MASLIKQCLSTHTNQEGENSVIRIKVYCMCLPYRQALKSQLHQGKLSCYGKRNKLFLSLFFSVYILYFLPKENIIGPFYSQNHSYVRSLPFQVSNTRTIKVIYHRLISSKYPYMYLRIILILHLFDIAKHITNSTIHFNRFLQKRLLHILWLRG